MVDSATRMRPLYTVSPASVARHFRGQSGFGSWYRGLYSTQRTPRTQRSHPEHPENPAGRGLAGNELPNVELTLLVGRPAQFWALGKRAGGSMTETVRAWRAFLPDALVLPHPSWRNTAWLKKNPWFEDEVAPYLRQRVALTLAR